MMTIVERPCPRCGIRRSVRFGRLGSYCFNCKFRWHGSDSATPITRPRHVRVAEYPFGPAELTRLEIYRAAVQAGFYNEWPVNESVER
jgi:hypothetical protein